jgi:hypothetical protein
MSGIIGNNIVRNGLVLHLDAADRKSYPGSGTVWYDRSGNRYNGTLTNGPTFNNSNGGNIVFDGVDDYSISTSFTPNITNKTLAGWCKLGSVSQQGGGLINIQNVGGNLYFDAIVYNETGNGWGFGSDFFNRTGWSGVKETSTSQWVYMVATYQNLNYNMYRNGALIYNLTSFNALNFNFSSESLIGLRHTGGGNAYLSATVAMAQIYNRALSASEVLQNFNATRTRFNI